MKKSYEEKNADESEKHTALTITPFLDLNVELIQ